MPLYPRNVASQGACPTFYSYVIFTSDSYLSQSRSLGGRHYYNNRFSFHMPMFIIYVLSFNKLNTTIHSNIKFIVIAYNQNLHFRIRYKKF
jgi:hypothetical protein